MKAERLQSRTLATSLQQRLEWPPILYLVISETPPRTGSSKDKKGPPPLQPARHPLGFKSVPNKKMVRHRNNWIKRTVSAPFVARITGYHSVATLKQDLWMTGTSLYAPKDFVSIASSLVTWLAPVQNQASAESLGVVELIPAAFIPKASDPIQVRIQTTLCQLSPAIHDSFFWTDSSCVLPDVANDDRRYKTFVANRVAAIREH